MDLAIREDLWREAAADRARDEELGRDVAALMALMGELGREERVRDLEAEPWEWVERISLLLGLTISGWMARGGLVRACRRLWRALVGPPPSPAPVIELV